MRVSYPVLEATRQSFTRLFSAALLLGALSGLGSCQKEATDTPAPSAKPATQNELSCTTTTMTEDFGKGPVTFSIQMCHDSGIRVFAPDYPTSWDTGIDRDSSPGGGGNENYEHISTDLHLTAGPAPTEPQNYNCVERKSAPETRRLLGTFLQDNVENTRAQVLTQRGWYAPWYDNLVQLPKGPTVRYIRDPLNSALVIDLQRMLVMGNWGMSMATSNEIEMALTNSDGYSGYTDRDYYSLHLGQDFYTNYVNQLAANPGNFAQVVADFLNDPAQRTAYTNPDPNLCR